MDWDSLIMSGFSKSRAGAAASAVRPLNRREEILQSITTTKLSKYADYFVGIATVALSVATGLVLIALVV